MAFATFVTKFFPPVKANAERAEDYETHAIARSTKIEEARDPEAARLTIRLGGVLVIAFLIWAALTPLHELTTSEGTILPEGFVQDIQHFEGGIVTDVRVQDGDRVGAGEILVRLDDLAARAELAKAEARLVSLNLTSERLNAFVEERAAKLDAETDEAGILGSQRAVETTRSELRKAQIAIVQSEIEGRENEIAGLISQIEVVREELALVSARADDYDSAAKRGAISRREAEAVKREKLKLDGELLRLKGQVNAARAGLTEARSRGLEVRAQLSTEALEQLTQVETERAEVTALVEQLRDQIARATIAAPMDGTVHSIAVRGPGEVVTPGEVILQLVPDNEEIFAEVEIPAENIGYIEPGMPANVKVTAYDFARFGGVEGVVDRVSPSNKLKEDGRMVFTARIHLGSDHVGAASAGRTVNPGMTVIADIKTGRKSVLAFLMKPLRALSDSALTER